MISPQNAARITPSETTALKRAEEHIDNELNNRYQGNGTVRVYLKTLRLSERAKKELARRYRIGGWRVKEGHDAGNQREPNDPSGPYFEFSAEPRPPSSTGQQIADIEAQNTWGTR